MIGKKLLAVSVSAAALLVGCGGGSSTPSSTTVSTGYFVDAPVANIDYDCVADGTMDQKTGPDGSFSCKTMAHVRFRIGELVLGEVAAVPADRYVFPQDLVGVARESGVNDTRVAVMAQLLQSLDTDGNPSNGITIAQSQKELLVEAQSQFDPAQLPVYLESASVNPVHIPTLEHAKEHLRTTMHSVTGAVQTPSAPQQPKTPQTPSVPQQPQTPYHDIEHISVPSAPVVP